MRRQRTAQLVGLAAVALLLADVGAALATGSPRSPASLAASVPQLERFVQADRGLRFVRPVRVITLSRSALSAYLQQHEGVTAIDRAEATLDQALGLVPSADAYVRHLQVEAAADVAGLYSDGTDTIRVVAGPADPFARSVVVHELTHALDDQHRPLAQVRKAAFATAASASDGAFEGVALPDVETGVAGLIEGDAERVREDYLARLSRTDAAAERAAEQVARAAVPFDADDRTLAPLTDLPYVNGVSYTRALLAHGAQAELDATFDHPPATTREVLHPEASAADVPTPTVGIPPGELLATGTAGEAVLAVVLGEVSRGVVRSTLASGWRADRIAISRSADRACVAWTVALAGPPGPVADLLRTRLPGAAVSATSDGLQLTGCR